MPSYIFRPPKVPKDVTDLTPWPRLLHPIFASAMSPENSNRLRDLLNFKLPGVYGAFFGESVAFERVRCVQKFIYDPRYAYASANVFRRCY